MQGGRTTRFGWLVPIALIGCDLGESRQLIEVEPLCQGQPCPEMPDATADAAASDAIVSADSGSDAGNAPDAAAADSGDRDSAAADGARSDVGARDAAPRDRQRTDRHVDDLGASDSAQADASQPDGAPGDSARADGAQPDAARPDTARPDTAGTDAGPCAAVTCGAGASCTLLGGSPYCICAGGSIEQSGFGCPPYAAPDFDATDNNALSATSGQELTLSGQLGKVVVVYSVTYS